MLSLTGNALADGTVFATAGIPRALFMLVGGALTDRFAPRRLMMNSNIGRMILTGLLAALVATLLFEVDRTVSVGNWRVPGKEITMEQSVLQYTPHPHVM